MIRYFRRLSIDRIFLMYMSIGDKETFNGILLFQTFLQGKFLLSWLGVPYKMKPWKIPLS